MIVIGERLNTSRKEVADAVQRWDAAYVQEQAKKQAEAGAKYIDVNAGTFMEEEPERLQWLAQTVQEAVDLPLCIDSPNPAALKAALKVHRGKAIVNSITGERERYEAVLPIAQEHGAGLIVLCINDYGIPGTVKKRCEISHSLIERLVDAGIPQEDICVDPLIRPLSTENNAGMVALETIRYVAETFPRVHRVCGLSNISFGLPLRKLLNQTLLVMAIAAGLDSAILDPLDQGLMARLYAANAMTGNDASCFQYLKAYRAGRLVV